MNRNRMAMVMAVLMLVFLFCAASLAADAEPKVGQTVSNVNSPSSCPTKTPISWGRENPQNSPCRTSKLPTWWWSR
jgi:hypothetical protein